MPPTQSLAPSTAYRHSSTSSRLRENRIQTVVPGPSTRRRKSRSPEVRMLEEAAVRNDRRLMKSKGAPTVPSLTTGVRASTTDDSDRGRKLKSRSKAPSLLSEGNNVLVLQDVTPSGTLNRSKRKERSKSGETTQRLSKKAVSPDITDYEEDNQSTRGGTTTSVIAELTRVKQELERMHKQMTVAKKTIHKQSKVIDELRQDLTNAARSREEHERQIERLNLRTRKNEELVSNVESNLMCQICMDILLRPFSLSPCGHVLCQTCLQEWFRAAPPQEYDMNEDGPEALIHRDKSCPCCRTIVRSRPTPLFLVKSLAATFEKAKAPPGAPRRTSPPPEADPWAGIFMDPNMLNSWGVDSDDMDDDDDEDDDDDGDYDDDDPWDLDGYGTPEDEERYNGRYVRARWEPPHRHVSPDDYPFVDRITREELAMLRRGATMQMIDVFDMSYSNEHGLRASFEDNILYLGWNIELQPDDESGEEFMNWAIADVYERPERWDMHEDEDGSWTAWRLVREDDEDESVGTTDSEMWAEGLADDMED